MATVRALGTPEFVLCSVSHDSFVAEWKQTFPNVQVVAQRKSAKVVGENVKVDVILEDVVDEINMKYGIKEVLNTSSWSTFEDCVLIVDRGDDKEVALFGCGVSNHQVDWTNPLSWPVLFGYSGLRMTRIFAFMFCKNMDAAQRFWKDLQSRPALDTLVLLHGLPLQNDCKYEMCRVDLSKARHWTSFGF